MVESVPIYGIFRSLIRWLPPFFLRRYYSSDRLGKLIYLDLQPRHEAALINLGEAAQLRIALHLINLSPFSVQVDRGSFRFVYAGATVKLSYLNRVQVEPGATVALYLEEAVSDGHANQIARNWEGNQAWLEGSVEFNCGVRSFAKDIGNLSGIRVVVINAVTRIPVR